MHKENYNVIGVMSGTSLDGVDLAHIKFEINNHKWSYEIYECDTISYSNEIISKLKNGINFSKDELSELNLEYTNLLGNIISDFILKNNISNLDAVCSHGHTILHQPQNGFTLQIGNLPEIAKITHQKVVCDFRVQDVNLGGQGAPLVPIGDRILFSDFDYCLNLGGFSNISFEANNQRIAFDISPVNTVLNFYANTFGLEYDDKGKISASGNLNSELYEELNNLEFFHKSYPKSLGFEFVKETVLPIIERYQISTEDKMRTFTEHIAFQIGNVLQSKSGKLLVSGGGVYNDFLIERMKAQLPTIEIIIPDEKTIKFKEALIFALLGVLKLRNEINVLASVTGAKHDHSSGEIFE
ncbi:anhydro-N-acetylmuramic acid kinase [Flavobacterium urocaniciphilum]|uniref:Anhydro-N-acetylmuramic acid kinase n=1 Tax=Flavobacterium urocaniciphilum TaxID=1299341 RepID=A0A1H8YR36_9FLAO|nr:anhydro-N-acetylmuramic acid kinase [Flavobacterium urocaniciphilum]SEP54675.1 anhydro-N-acetylmuramic acid kinase [Flavobacterium urocaniciphilum]